MDSDTPPLDPTSSHEGTSAGSDRPDGGGGGPGRTARERAARGFRRAGAAADPRTWNRTHVAIVLVPLLVLVTGFLVVDSLVYGGRVSGGVEVGGIDIGGLSPEAATKALRERAQTLASEPIRFRHEGEIFATTPAELGWTPDVPATRQRAMEVGQEGLPWTRVWDRIRGLFGSVGIPWLGGFDEGDVAEVTIGWEERLGAAPREGLVRVVDDEVLARDPAPGLGVDPAALAEQATDVVNGDAGPTDPVLPAHRRDPFTTAEDVAAAVRTTEEVISAPITADFKGTEITLQPEELGPLVRTSIDPAAKRPLVLGFAPTRVGDLLEPNRRRIEIPARDAEFMAGKRVRIRDSRSGRTIDPALAATRLLRIATSPSRQGRVGLVPLEPGFSTEDAEALGIRERLATFTTYYPAGESRVINIQTAAAGIDGTVLEPGEQFSMNGVLGQRTLEGGYVEAPAIVDGKFKEQIGGGVSQLATTTFNAAFFSGLPFQEYQAHSFYFDRYPLGREATVSWTAPDLKFTNDTKDAALILASAGSTSVTVSIYGTNPGREVEATDPELVSETKAGFTVLVERVISDRKGDVIDRDTFRTYYKNQ
ncbi:MAG: VanW family protein [Actinomycetota bacterium]